MARRSTIPKAMRTRSSVLEMRMEGMHQKVTNWNQRCRNN